MNNQDYTSIVLHELIWDSAFDFLSVALEQPYGITITSEDGVIVYRQSEGIADDAFRQIDSFGSAGGLRDQYMVDTVGVRDGMFTISLIRPLSALTALANRTASMAVLAGVISMTVLTLSVYILSSWLVRPLKELADNMLQVEKSGEFIFTVKSRSRDEVGLLISRFNSMLNTIRQMIGQLYQSRIDKQEYEMRALQAQINPHFLYNSLSLINSKAILADHQDIASAAQYLSTYFRTTLNKGDRTIPFRQEWDNMNAYIQIQRMMHRGSFEIRLSMGEGTGDVQVPNLIIQPMVENAITHGLDCKETGDAPKLTVDARLEGDALLVDVTDNGCGMDAETIVSLLTRETPGYGVYNVHQRIRLLYGEPWGLYFKSRPGEGTVASVRLPARHDMNLG